MAIGQIFFYFSFVSLLSLILTGLVLAVKYPAKIKVIRLVGLICGISGGVLTISSSVYVNIKFGLHPAVLILALLTTLSCLLIYKNAQLAGVLMLVFGVLSVGTMMFSSFCNCYNQTWVFGPNLTYLYLLGFPFWFIGACFAQGVYLASQRLRLGN